MLRSSRIRSWRKSARLTIHPIYMQRRRKSGSDRERDGRERGVHHHQMHRVRLTPRVHFSSLRRGNHRRRNRARLPLSHFYSFSTLFLDYGLSAAPFVIAYFYPRPAVIYFGTEIRFAKRRAAHCVPHRKAAFIVIFTFTSRAVPPGSGAMHRHIHSYIFSLFFGRNIRTISPRYI